MSIGAFAELAGLTASALRFYDDAGVITPARVDPGTGYRLYSHNQLTRAVQVRRLREIGMPLRAVGRFFEADSREAACLIDDQVARADAELGGIRQAAASLKASLGEEARPALCTLVGPVLAGAVDQVLASTVDDPEARVLSGVHLEVGPNEVTLIATDRYRLTTRTIVPDGPSTASWAGTVSGDDLRSATSRLRRSPSVSLGADDRFLGLRTIDGEVIDCALMSEVFPDHRRMTGSLPSVTHRVVVDKHRLVEMLERHAPEQVGLRVGDGRPALVLPDEVLVLDGSATGPQITVWFELASLYPAASHSLGSDLVLDLRGDDQPATVRSADAGDLTAIVMPCRDPATTTPENR